MKKLKQYIVFIFYGLVLNIVDFYLCKDTIGAYLKLNIITFLVTIIALNLTAVIFLFTRLTDEYKGVFNDTINEIHLSIKDQIIIIPISLVLISINEDYLKIMIIYGFNFKGVQMIMIHGIFIFSVYSIWDIAEATFLYVKHINR